MKPVNFLKFTTSIVCAVLAIVLASCSDDDDKNSVIKFNPPTVSVMVGNTQNVAVAGGQGAYTAKSSDEKIATVTVDKTTITVKGVKAGKATILVKDSKNVMGSLRVTVVDGIIVNSLRRSKVPYLRRAQGVVFQDFRLLPNKTVYENVAFAMEIVGKSRREIRRKVPKILGLVGLADRAKNYPNEISGGEQQRVSIARALVNSPSLIIADEPTGNLDVDTASDVMTLFEQINKMGTTIVMVTHSEKIVNDMCKRVIQLENGAIVRDEEKGVYNLGV